jgi:hypothetical protein
LRRAGAGRDQPTFDDPAQKAARDETLTVEACKLVRLKNASSSIALERF